MIRQGTSGMLLSEGETVLTVSGRTTSPFPKVDVTTERRASNTLRRVDAWLICNALDEAIHRRDGYNRTQFAAVQLDNVSSADRMSADMYLFGM